MSFHVLIDFILIDFIILSSFIKEDIILKGARDIEIQVLSLSKGEVNTQKTIMVELPMSFRGL